MSRISLGLRLATTVAATVAIILVGATAARADLRGLASPGPLSQGHAKWESQCDQCHVPFKGIPDTRCLDCHKDTAERIATGVGTHARWHEEKRACVGCHKDHKGRGHALSPEIARPFDHAITGFLLSGAHQKLDCDRCHKPSAATASSVKWTGLSHDCVGCHRATDAHKGALGTRCAVCHVDTSWKTVRHPVAEHRLDMSGGHDRLACSVCHRGGAHLVKSATCGDCHQERHGGTGAAACTTCHHVDSWQNASFTHDFCSCILPGKHQSTACLNCHTAYRFKPTPMVCAGCHEKDRPHEDLGACARCHSALSWKTRVFDHNAKSESFHVDGRHEEVACESCHTKKHSFRGAPQSCEGCHKTPKHGDFGACATCHTTAGFDKPKFSHDTTRFPLDGKHREVRCETCHARWKKGSFVPGPDACAQCHGDPHKGQFSTETGSLAPSPRAFKWGPLFAAAGPAVPMPPASHDPSHDPSHGPSHDMGRRPSHSTSGRCVDCHSTRGWKPSTVDVAAHARFGYPLRGAHQSAACARCHEGGVYLGTATACAACHVDCHRGRLGDECERCHNERGWREHPPFDHRAATGFALDGAHAEAACADCHGPDGARLVEAELRPGGVGCATCHTPRHGDAFGPDCGRCHTPTRFEDVRFDHSTTTFPLERRHRALRCAECHDPAKGARAARPPSECKGCHGDPHGGRIQPDCAECHRPDSWLIVRFDHDRSEFPLRGRHYITPCRDCHTFDQWTGIRRECVSCHRGDRQRANQEMPSHGGFGWNCIDCHRPFRW